MAWTIYSPTFESVTIAYGVRRTFSIRRPVAHDHPSLDDDRVGKGPDFAGFAGAPGYRVTSPLLLERGGPGKSEKKGGQAIQKMTTIEVAPEQRDHSRSARRKTVRRT